MAALKIITTSKGKQIYTDKGTGADTDVSVFQPDIPDGFFMVGQFAQPHDTNQMYTVNDVPLIKPLEDTAVAPSVSFQAMWNDMGSGGDQNVTFWRVIAPPGYVALGDIVMQYWI